MEKQSGGVDDARHRTGPNENKVKKTLAKGTRDKKDETVASSSR